MCQTVVKGRKMSSLVKSQVRSNVHTQKIVKKNNVINYHRLKSMHMYNSKGTYIGIYTMSEYYNT